MRKARRKIAARGETVTGIGDASDLADFILTGYKGRVVEVGIGSMADVAVRLHSLDVIATDKEDRIIGGLAVKKDDIFSPKKEIYEGASLIYSIRPSVEMQLAIGRVALEVGADVLIRPLCDEVAQLPGFKRSLVNTKEARFYLFRPLR
jgi:uncharacterized UPF0146 family protein